jgi:hypothetical protein
VNWMGGSIESCGPWFKSAFHTCPNEACTLFTVPLSLAADLYVHFCFLLQKRMQCLCFSNRKQSIFIDNPKGSTQVTTASL